MHRVERSTPGNASARAGVASPPSVRLTLEQLIYFQETAKHEHVGRAAKTLHLSRSAISHALSSLEDEVGLTLFERHGRNLRLTVDGRRLEAHVSRVIEELEALKAGLAASHADCGHLRLGALHIACGTVLVPAWRAVASRFPLMTFELLASRSADIVRQVLDGELDAGLCMSPTAHPDLSAETVAEGDLRVLVGPRHPLVGCSASVVLERLATYPATMPKPIVGVEVCELHPVLSAHGIRPRTTVSYDSLEVAVAVLDDGETWTLGPDITAAWNPGLVALAMPRSWTAPYTFTALRHRTHRPSAVVEDIVGAARRLCEVAHPRLERRT